MVDLPGLLFISAACFLIGLIFGDVLWEIRAFGPEPYTEETSSAITALYANNLGTLRRPPYLIVLMPMAFLVVVGSLAYKGIRGLDAGDRHAVLTSAASMVIIFPLIAIAASSTFPTIRALIAQGRTLPLEERHRMHRRLCWQHVVYCLLTAIAIVVHVAL